MPDQRIFGNRKSVAQLPPGKTFFSSSLLTSDPPPVTSIPRPDQHEGPPSLDAHQCPDGTQPPERPLRPRKSISSSLYNLFNRPKVERARGHTEALPLPLSLPQRPPSPPPPPSDPLHRRTSTRLSTRSRTASRFSFISPELPLPKTPARPASRLSLARAPSTKPTRGQGDAQDDLIRITAPWDPPPLFQAYPQAVRHIALEAPYPPTEKGQSDKKNTQDDAQAKSGKSRPLFARSMSRRSNTDGITTRGDLKHITVKKIYVLVTSGHLLEYAGDGPSDRLPDKVLKLGKDSAAFVSDLVPGRPFVLQVLAQAVNGEALVTMPQKSVLSRLGLQTASSRRTALSLLLVFGRPEEMDLWINSIRREIESLGGKKYRPTSTARILTDDDAMSIATTHRYQNLRRNSSRMSDYAPSLKSVPSIKFMPSSPTVDTSDRVDSANFSGVTSEWSSSWTFNQQLAEIGLSDDYLSNLSRNEPLENLSFEEERSDSVELPHQSLGNLSDSTPKDFSDFNFGDIVPCVAAPQTFQSLPSNLKQLPPVRDRPRSMEPSVNSGDPRTSVWQKHATHDFSKRSLVLKEHQPSPSTQGDRSWPSGLPRYSLSPATYSYPSVSSISSEGMESTDDPSTYQGEIATKVLKHIKPLPFTPIPVNTADARKSFQKPILITVERSAHPAKPISIPSSPFLVQHQPQRSTNLSTQPTIRTSEPRTSFRSTSPIPLRTSTVQQWYPAPSSPRPASRSTSPTPPNPLRRPASLPVHSDHAPFLSSMKLHFPLSPEHRRSVLVPAVRPATIRSVSAARRRQSANLLMTLSPPPNPPPSAPLPMPPGLAV